MFIDRSMLSTQSKHKQSARSPSSKHFAKQNGSVGFFWQVLWIQAVDQNGVISIDCSCHFSKFFFSIFIYVLIRFVYYALGFCQLCVCNILQFTNIFYETTLWLMLKSNFRPSFVYVIRPKIVPFVHTISIADPL